MSLGVARIFDWGRGANCTQRRHQNFLKEELIVGQRNPRIEDQKPWPGLALDQYFGKGRGLKRKVKKVKISKVEDVLNKEV